MLCDELAAHRAAIDDIDGRLLELLNERATHSLAIREIKAQRGLGVYDQAREEQIVEALQARNTGPLHSCSIAEIYGTVLAVMRKL